MRKNNYVNSILVEEDLSFTYASQKFVIVSQGLRSQKIKISNNQKKSVLGKPNNCTDY